MHDTRRDALGRRSRTQPASTGKRVTPQPRDLLWFQKIHEHGPLSSTYLHAFSKHLAINEKRARDRLTDLFNEANTRHGGAYLTRPYQQFQTFDARYQNLVYELGVPAQRALQEASLWHEYGANAGGPWRHRFMVAAITASIELATLDDPHLTFIPQRAILKRANAALRHSVPFKNPTTGALERRDLIPDALFGLEYRHTGTKRYRFFLVEADRSMEPSRASTFNRKSHLRTFLQYQAYVGGGLYKARLGLTASMLVLHVAGSEATAQRMVRLLRQLSQTRADYQLVTAVHELGGNFKPPPILGQLLYGPWSRAGHPMQIDVPVSA